MPKQVVGPRVLAVSRGWSGCHFHRLAMPTKYASHAGFRADYVTPKEAYYRDLTEYDVLLISQASIEGAENARRFCDDVRRGAPHLALVVDFDDDSWAPEGQRPGIGWSLTDAEAASMAEFARSADLVTVTVEHLAQRIRAYGFTDRVTVVPNAMDPLLYQPTPRTDPRLTIGTTGGKAHYDDWHILADLIPILAERYPDVRFLISSLTTFDYLEALKPRLGDRLTLLGEWVSVTDHPTKLVSQIDIGLCPLGDTLFNRSKSPIKAWEFACYRRPVVASPTVYANVIRHGRNGYLATTLDEWIEHVSHLIESRFARQTIGKRAYEEVYQHHNIHQRPVLDRWLNAWREAIRIHQRNAEQEELIA